MKKKKREKSKKGPSKGPETVEPDLAGKRKAHMIIKKNKHVNIKLESEPIKNTCEIFNSSREQQRAAESSRERQRAAESSRKQQRAAESSREQQRAAERSRKKQRAAENSRSGPRKLPK